MRRTNKKWQEKKMRGMRVIFLSNSQKIVPSKRTLYMFRKEKKGRKKNESCYSSYLSLFT
jgi:hypothetical protein